MAVFTSYEEEGKTFFKGKKQTPGDSCGEKMGKLLSIYIFFKDFLTEASGIAVTDSNLIS